jgi:hypothetical protein
MKTPLKHMATLVAVLAATLVHAQAQLIKNGNFADGGNNWTVTTGGGAEVEYGNYNYKNWGSSLFGVGRKD